MIIYLCKYISNELFFRIKNVGKLPICNCRKDRAPHIGALSFILCWRCTSILISFFILKILDNRYQITDFFIYKSSIIFIIISLAILIIPAMFDGIRQYYFDVESTNFKRIITGLPCGIGLYLITKIIKSIIFL